MPAPEEQRTHEDATYELPDWVRGGRCPRLDGGPEIAGKRVRSPARLVAWEKYRDTVNHPCVTFKPADVARAKENINRYAWAKDYAEGVERNARRYLNRLTPEFLVRMIPETTPGDSLWTPCPSCRAQGKPLHPHGLWTWRVEDPDHIQCDMCGMVFPNDQYPEDVVLRTRWRRPQTISFCGGDPFVIFRYKTGRPSFTANVRARKVKWMAGYCRSAAEAYLRTGKPEYARACRVILLRFAACYPEWLVHVGYGQYADMDPRVASLHIQRLPEPELCPPPNKPDRRLHTGYWSAGRAGGVGMESGFVRQVVEAYDFTCQAQGAGGEPIYSGDDRRKIERNLLLESTILLVCDKEINNKSVSNRTAAALVGMCVGHPELVRFGLEGFSHTVDGWFLQDGATSESPSYGTMALGGIWDLAQALRGYSDPPGYRDAAGQHDWRNSDIGATIPYIVRRCEGDGARTFVPVFEGHEGDTLFVRGVKLLDPSGVLLVETAKGQDYVMSSLDKGTLLVPGPAGDVRLTAHFAAASVQDGQVAWTFVQPDLKEGPQERPR